uniref:RoaA protein n=1 Tax=Euglena mutabilis TaxID=38275 RepID=A0A1B0UKZ4_EUGMU|nr:roaA protein [Euglena mutabilis]
MLKKYKSFFKKLSWYQFNWKTIKTFSLYLEDAISHSSLEHNRRSSIFYIFVFFNSSSIKLALLNNILEDLENKNIFISLEEKYQILLTLDDKINELEVNNFFISKDKGQSTNHVLPSLRKIFILNSYSYLLALVSEEALKKSTFYPRTYRDTSDFIRKLKEELHKKKFKRNYISKVKMLFTKNKISKVWLLKNLPFRRHDIIKIFLDNITNFFYNKKIRIKKDNVSFYFNKFYFLLVNFLIHEINNLDFYHHGLRKHYTKTLLNSFYLIRNKDKIYTLTCSKTVQKYSLSLINTFLKMRGINWDYSLYSAFNFAEQKINIGDYEFMKDANKNITCLLLKNHLKNYKNKLKMIIKSNKFRQINNIIINLNNELKVWRNNNFFLNNFLILTKELDLYMNKLLWRYVKRLHSRRSKTWIYKKYWICISGNWRFISKDQVTGKINVLLSHFFTLKSVFISRIPLITNFFHKVNLKKIFYIRILKVKNSLTGITSLIYNRQKGFCYKCKLPMFETRLKILKIQKRILILVHYTCDKIQYNIRQNNFERNY